jgi:uncharacterized protein YbcV (DUF1398 family)
MDAQRISIAQTCLNAAYDGSMTFPDIVGRLIEAGFEGYAVDYRRHVTTYFLPDGESVELENRPTPGAVSAVFDRAGVAAQVKWAQANPLDYSYQVFCENVKGCGCAGYMASFLGRRVLYFGRTAETHVEHFPQ